MSEQQENYVNPFDDDQHKFLVLINAAGQYSIWPEFADVPPGWTQCFGTASRADCLEYVEVQWLTINPFAPSLKEGIHA